MRARGSVIFTGVIVVFLVVMLLASRGLRFGAWLYPVSVMVPTLILAFIQLAREIRGSIRVRSERGMDLASEDTMPATMVYGRAVRYLSWMLGLYVGIWLIGFKLATIVFFVLFLKIEGRAKWWLTLVLTAGAVFLMVMQFGRLLGVHWPEGLIEQYLTVPF